MKQNETESYSNLNLYQKLAMARSRIKVQKEGKNQHGNYFYYRLDDIYNAAISVFHELGIMTFPRVKQIGETTIRTFSKEGQKEHIVPLLCAELTVVNADKPEEREVLSLDIPYSFQAGSSLAQSLGGTKTYAIKYLFSDLLMLDDTADDDATNEHGKGDKKNDTQKEAKKAIRPSVPPKDLNPKEDTPKVILAKTLIEYGVPNNGLQGWIKKITGMDVIGEDVALTITSLVKGLQDIGVKPDYLQNWLIGNTGRDGGYSHDELISLAELANDIPYKP